jgi:hypothetical protein
MSESLSIFKFFTFFLLSLTFIFFLCIFIQFLLIPYRIGKIIEINKLNNNKRNNNIENIGLYIR